MKKKIISFLMAMMVAASVMPAAVLAEGETSPEIMHFHLWWTDERNASDGFYYTSGPAGGSGVQGNYLDVELNDATSGAAGGLIQTRAANGNDWSADDWAYQGATFNYMGQAHQTDEFWGDLYDASDIVDTAYIVAKIKPVNISGIDTAYLAVSSANSEWGIEEWVVSKLDDITPENYPDLTKSVKLYNQTVAGAKLTDYYDVAVGGNQTVAVPLSKFVNDPDFLDSYKKATVGGKIYPQYINSFGFARTDSDAGKVFDIECTYLGLVNIATPAAPTAVLNEDGTVTVSWSATANSDVTYKVERTKGNEATTVYEGSATSFTDTLPASGAYSYTVQLVFTTPDEYKKHNPASSKAGDVVAELAKSAASNEIISGDADASRLLVEDFTVIGVSGNDTTQKARPWPFFIGDLRVGSSNGGELQKFRFNYNGYYDRYSSEYHRWWLNDSGYEYDGFTTDQNRGRAITYRPLTAEEGYMAERTSGSNVYKANAYVEHYVAYDAAPKNWGFNGFRYVNKVVADNNQRDLTSYVDTGYILYTINLPEGMNADGLYLAISETTGDWNDNGNESPWGQVAVGVPLEDYYDVEARGWQTVMVPMSAYSFKDEDVFVGAYAGSDGVWFKSYKDYRKYQDTHWDQFTGIGVVRQDVDNAVCEEFYIDVKNLAIVNNVVGDPVLTAAFDADAQAVNLEWSSSGYTNTTYTITKSNGTTTETIDAGASTSYTDADLATGNYTYVVTSAVGKYAIGKTSATASVAVEIATPEPDEPEVPDEPVVDSNYTVVEDMDWENWSAPAKYTNYLADRAIYVSREGGEERFGTGFTNDYQSNWSTTATEYIDIEINDTGYNDGGDAYEGNIATLILLKDKTTESKALREIPTTDGNFWGYKGSKYYLGSYEEIPSNWSKDRWFGVKDISAYENTGYLAFDVEMDATDDIENAYFAIEVATAADQLANKGGVTLPITEDQIASIKSKWETKTSFVLGVPVADYYDTLKMGRQKVYVPISEFTNNPEFREMYSKTTSGYVEDFADKLANCKTDLRLFMGMGIAKKNSADYQANPKAFNAKVYDLTVEVPKQTEIIVRPVKMGDFADRVKAWDVAIKYFDAAKSYIAKFTAGADSMESKFDFGSNLETSGDVAFAVLLKTTKANVLLNITAE